MLPICTFRTCKYLLLCTYVCMYVCMYVYMCVCTRRGRDENISSGWRLRAAHGIYIHGARGKSIRCATQTAHWGTQSLRSQPLVRHLIHKRFKSRLGWFCAGGKRYYYNYNYSTSVDRLFLFYLCVDMMCVCYNNIRFLMLVRRPLSDR